MLLVLHTAQVLLMTVRIMDAGMAGGCTAAFPEAPSVPNHENAESMIKTVQHWAIASGRPPLARQARKSCQPKGRPLNVDLERQPVTWVQT